MRGDPGSYLYIAWLMIFAAEFPGVSATHRARREDPGRTVKIQDGELWKNRKLVFVDSAEKEKERHVFRDPMSSQTLDSITVFFWLKMEH